MNLLATDNRSTSLQLALANLYLQVDASDRAAAIYAEIIKSGQGRGEAEFGLATIAAKNGNQPEAARLLAIAENRGGVPVTLLLTLKK